MADENLDQNGGGGGQSDPDPNVNANSADGDPKPGDGAGDDPKPGGDGDAGNDGGDPIINFIDSIPETDREGFGDFQGKTVDEFVKHYKTLQDGKVVVPEAYDPLETITIKNQGNYDQLTKFFNRFTF